MICNKCGNDEEILHECESCHEYYCDDCFDFKEKMCYECLADEVDN